jgi:cathepsin L
MRLSLVGLLLLSSSAFAAPNNVVEIGGKKFHTGYLPRPVGSVPFYRSVTPRGDLPESYDSREFGLVTPAKDQGGCGSCWAFARTKAFEAALLKSEGGSFFDTLDLAEQDTLVNDHRSAGCNGGYMDGEFEVEQGQTTEDHCPYRASGRYPCGAEKYGKATRWAMLGSAKRAPSVDELRQAIVDYGVIAVTVAASGSFSPNNEGRITSCGGRRLNHMVTLAGYRPAPSGGYEFLIGNSWGTGWGVDGFAWSKQGCNSLASDPSDAALYFYVE